MGLDHRKLQLKMGQSSPNCQRTATCISCLSRRCNNCPEKCRYEHPHLHPPPLPPPMSVGGVDSKQNHSITASMTLMVIMIVIGLLFGIFCAAMRVFYLRRNNSRRRASPPIIFGTQEEFLDENHGPAVDHHFWHINTVGLLPSVIDSITAFKYRKEDCLIEGTECSVCLSEFQEDDNLRLLPKCSHAFHIPCIDTWLRSHKNCPMCRAPVICGTIAAQASEPELNLNNDLDSGNENTVENPSREENINVEVGSSEVGNGHDSGVLSDIADDRRVVDEDLQPIRRSVSLDSSSAATIHNAVAARSLKSKNSKSNMDGKASSVSSSIGKLMKSSSSGSSLQKGSISMKRVSSRSSSRHCRRHSSLPL